MSLSQQSVEQTLRYASFFKLPLTNRTLHHWLINPKTISAKFIATNFPQVLSTKDQQIIQTAKQIAQQKRPIAFAVARLMSYFPTTRLVAITGSLAIDNANKDDDIDLMIVTSTNTLWLTRLFIIPLISLLFKRRTPKISNLKSQISNAICLNLWLDESALVVPVNKRNLYTAHEVLQVQPIFDRGDTYQKFILANSWTKTYLANAYSHAVQDMPTKRAQTSERSDGREHVFWYIRTVPNWLAFKFQYLYMKKKITTETVTLHSAYFHPRNLSKELDHYLS